MHERAGTVALPEDLIDVDGLLGAFYDVVPDHTDPLQRVSFGTSGHRGTSTNGTFNEAHIVSITAAIVEYRAEQGTDGPLFVGADPHALSEPAWRSALEVLSAAGVTTYIDARRSWTPTPAVSLAILEANGAPHELRQEGPGLADGIVITPSHNPPADGGFKYNPPTGGPADSDATGWIANRANELLEGGWRDVPRIFSQEPSSMPNIEFYDYLGRYVDALDTIIDFEAIREAGVRIGSDPLGGAAVDYWGAIGERYGLDLTVVNETVDPRWPFMTLDWDGKIRMDCSSPHAMASLLDKMVPDEDGVYPYDIATGNDADSDRHGIVTSDGLMNPNHFLAVAIQYLYTHRENWPTEARIGKTLVSSSLIDRVAASIGREVMEVPVGFKYFVAGLLDASLGFGGEESAGASFLRKDGTVWTTDKDGLVMGLLAAEIMAVTGKTPSQIHGEQVAEFGQSWYARIDQVATKAEKAKLAKLSPEDVTADTLAGEPITAKLVRAPGDNQPIGGLKVTTENSWFAARPSGTEDVYKIYAESFISAEHLVEVQEAAKVVVAAALAE
ncbi:phosphoglucomutase (alpha-D-glucose-1,6-bisphosphate-dependent) [Actinomyces minihominis]|uniref:phosphoglucomutase (alpha-D-glucose-1,6-bisphosphate-dependent) n=1 Tax=Actinomyces minihominis TaxID=2002838 RepID=UPI000C0821CB|nr:phosphoglucomutase (alpha-D-glucose-1,6-bisphosphate-dependent) [Actinomyces minihominis]